MNKRVSLSVGLLALAMTSIVVVSLAFPALAAPPTQGGDILPTPTLFPAGDVEYTMYSYGGTHDPQTFTHEPVSGFTFTDTTAVSLYPAGMTFSVGVESEGGDITSVQWVLRREETFGTSSNAEWDAEQGQWVAHPWADGGQPAGTEGDFHWQATDAAGNTVVTVPQFVIYWDPEHVWYRMESDYIVMHWYGIGDDPDAFAHGMAVYMAEVYPRWVAGFGRGLSYKPMALIYPDFESYSGRFLGGVDDPNVLGVTSGSDGFTTQRLRPAPLGPVVSDCLWARPAEFWTFERRVQLMYTVVGHEFTHLYQGDVLGGQDGPTWWSEGEAEWFANDTPEYADPRLHKLSTLEDMPTLQEEVGFRTAEADGCTRLAYDAGASFINWLLTNYGGIDTHLKIVQGMYSGQTLFAAIEAATGKPFLDIENEWRAYHGFRALTPEELNPSLALQTYDDPVLKVGDTVTIPAQPPIAMMYQDPAPNSLSSGGCWANMQAKILQIGQLGDVIYIQIDCLGQVGWVTRDELVAPGQ